MAVRIAISFFRPADLTNKSIATLEHTMRSNSPTAPEIAVSIPRTFPTASALSGTSLTPEPAFEDGYLAANPRVIVSISACACPRLTCFRKRATTP